MAKIFDINRTNNKITLGTTGTTINIASHTASLLLSLDASKNLESVTDLTAWVAGTANQITVTDDTDGTITLSLPVPNIKTDIWLAQDSNTFFGMGVAGTGDLTHGSGSEGYYNTFIGANVGQDIYTGYSNTAMGGDSLKEITTGYKNTSYGDNSLFKLISGNLNTAFGQGAGGSLVTGDSDVFLGHDAGYHETGSSKLFIDNVKRTNEADGRVKSLIYGVFAAAVADQDLVFNADVGINTVPTLPLDVKAIAGITAIGGYAIKLTNTTGANTIAGQVVMADPGTNDAVVICDGATTADSGDIPIGVFLDSGVADDAEAWVVVSGIADVAIEDNVAAVRGYWIGASADEDGYADIVDHPKNAPDHFHEMGHCIESVAAGGGGTHILARCVLHFN